MSHRRIFVLLVSMLAAGCQKEGGQGITTVTMDLLGEEINSTAIAVGADNLPFVAYYDGANFDLLAAKCGQADCSAGNSTTVIDSAGMVGTSASVAIGKDGFPVISYSDATRQDLKVVKCGNAACSAGNVITAVDTAGEVGEFTSIAVGADGLPVVSYLDFTRGNLKTVKCGNAACSSGNIVSTVDTTTGVGYYTSVAVGVDGMPVVSYYDYARHTLRAAKCGNPACTDKNTVTVVDSEGSVGGYTSIATGRDGFPIIAYYDFINHYLKTAKCANAACSGESSVTAAVDSGDAGTYARIVIGAKGLPLIAYYDGVSHDLKLLKCGNAACSEKNAVTTIDSAGNVGVFASMAADGKGLPAFAYLITLDEFRFRLRIAKCGNGECR